MSECELTEALGWALDNLRALAVGRWKPDDPAWQDMARARALLPTPPADDLAAARAEIERLRAALEMLHDDVAEYQRINKLGGYDNHVMRVARAALLPTRPDAKPAEFDAQASELRRTLDAERARGNLPPAPERERLVGRQTSMLTKDAARAEMRRLEGDVEFRRAYIDRGHPGHNEAVLRMTELAERANPFRKD